MKLKTGNKAPQFLTTDIFGNTIKSEDLRGKKLMLSFYRYASCPLCNLRVNQLIQKHDKLASNGLNIVSVFQSPVESILKYVGKQDAPFPIIADPTHTLYKLYGVSGNWAAFARAGLKLDKMAKAAKLGFMPGKMEGDIKMVPADFLIDEKGFIHTAYYGKDISDHIEITEIESFLN